MKQAVLVLLVTVWPGLASAGLTQRQLHDVALSPPPGARIPLALSFRDPQGHRVTLAEAVGGRPTLLLPADFTCTQICGPALMVAADALKATGLQAGRDYSFVVVGIDPADSLDDARRFGSGQVDGPGVSVLTGDAAAVTRLTEAIGYHFARDDVHAAIAHPAAAITLSGDGRVSHVLSSLALQPADLRLALIEAADGRVGGLAGRLSLLCYGFDAVHGVYTRQIATLLRVGGGAAVLALAFLLAWLRHLGRRRDAPA